ncbi:hypothetical protein GCM10027347_53810 [Larkinella harenae]
MDNLFGKFWRRHYKQKRPDDLFAYDYYFYNRYETLSVVSARTILALLPQKPDVIFIHWVTDFINAEVMHELKRLTNATLYWLVIDNSPLTGGCHYPWSCEGYKHSCSSCPAILAEPLKKLAEQTLAYKQKYIPLDLRLITFSQKDYARAKQSTLFRNKSVLKWLGFVDDEIFKPGNQTVARQQFDLSANQPVLFFGAASLKEKRKGMQLLLDALALNPIDNCVLLMAGDFPTEHLPTNVKKLGYLNDTELVLAYQAADAFICPSLEDSGPMMINQALMCGTPVVAFDTGVAQDLVITGQTGYRAQLGDAQDLAQGIVYILNQSAESRTTLRKHCRTLAYKSYGRAAFSDRLQEVLTT